MSRGRLAATNARTSARNACSSGVYVEVHGSAVGRDGTSMLLPQRATARAARKIPASRSAIPPSLTAPTRSPRRHQARRVEPIGSPRIATAISVAERYFSAQLKLVCPRSCGPIASATSTSQGSAREAGEPSARGRRGNDQADRRRRVHDADVGDERHRCAAVHARSSGIRRSSATRRPPTHSRASGRSPRCGGRRHRRGKRPRARRSPARSRAPSAARGARETPATTLCRSRSDSSSPVRRWRRPRCTRARGSRRRSARRGKPPPRRQAASRAGPAAPAPRDGGQDERREHERGERKPPRGDRQ